jgi:crotonobetainyl-CoA:carnitine CoA-transferase CaiB-like acyl-CoA transferase
MTDIIQSFPLSGIRVLDFSRVLAGPLCSMMLGDLGAHVLKVERPELGDDTRGWGPPFDADGESAYFRSINRNKLSLTANLDDAADQTLLLDLIAHADVIVENYLPGSLARKGLDAVSLLNEHPQLIWCSISGFGEQSARPGYDFVVQAESGWMSITGPEDGPPSKVGVALVDVIAGKDAAAAILAALVGRSRLTAAQRHVHVSLFGSATAALVNVAQNTLVSGSPPNRWGNAHPNLVPYQLFDASDRPLVLAVGNDTQWAHCARVLGVEAVDAWRTNAGRVTDRERLVPQLMRIIRTRSAAEWMDALARAGVPCGLVQSVPEALAHVTASAHWGVAPATGGTVRWPSPRLGEHNHTVRANGWHAFDVIAPPGASTASVTL